MSAPSVRLVEGRHITAQDKRNILGCIEFMRSTTPFDDGQDLWLGKKTSPKRYALTPATEPNRYTVKILSRYRSDHGQAREQISTVTVDVAGVLPLSATKADLIANQNDAFRSSLHGLAGPYPGKWVMSHDVSAPGGLFRAQRGCRGV